MNREPDALTEIAQRRTRSLGTIVQTELERMIVSGELKAGERLNEQQLADRLGVSRGPVREAARALEQAGLVTNVTNCGRFVRKIGFDEAMELYDMMAVVFGFACQRVALVASATQKTRFSDLIGAMSAAIERADRAGYYQLNLDFHDAMLEAAGHGRARRIYEALVNESHLFRQRALSAVESMRESNREHVEIMDAVLRGDAETARRRAERHALQGKRRWLTRHVGAEGVTA